MTLLSFDQWVETPPAPPTSDTIVEEFSRINDLMPLTIEAHLVVKSYGYEIRVMQETTTDVAGYNEVAEFDDDLSGFAEWVNDFDGLDPDEVEAIIEERIHQRATEKQARAARLYARAASGSTTTREQV